MNSKTEFNPILAETTLIAANEMVPNSLTFPNYILFKFIKKIVSLSKISWSIFDK